MIPKSRGEDVRPVTLVGYEEGPHPLISGKVKQWKTTEPFTPVTIIFGKKELRPATHSTLFCLILNV